MSNASTNSGCPHFTSVPDGIYALGKAHTCSTPTLRSFASVAFERVPALVWSTMAFFDPFKEDHPALRPSPPLSFRQWMVWCPWFCDCRQHLSLLTDNWLTEQPGEQRGASSCRGSHCCTTPWCPSLHWCAPEHAGSWRLLASPCGMCGRCDPAFSSPAPRWKSPQSWIQHLNHTYFKTISQLLRVAWSCDLVNEKH